MLNKTKNRHNTTSISRYITARHCLKTALAVIIAVLTGCCQAYAQSNKSTKAERNYVKDGNKAFNEQNYAEALQYYDLALAENALSEAALFNKALTLTRLSSPDDSVMMKTAVKIYNQLGESASDAAIKEKANYNLGNLTFHQQDYAKSIEYYKKVLRANPSNTKARENLRVAQLKLPPEQQNQDQNQNQDQEQQQQQQQQQQDQQQQQQQQQQLTGNAEQILQSMQNRENQTRKETEKKEVPVNGATTDKPW